MIAAAYHITTAGWFCLIGFAVCAVCFLLWMVIAGAVRDATRKDS